MCGFPTNRETKVLNLHWDDPLGLILDRLDIARDAEVVIYNSKVGDLESGVCYRTIQKLFYSSKTQKVQRLSLKLREIWEEFDIFCGRTVLSAVHIQQKWFIYN